MSKQFMGFAPFALIGLIALVVACGGSSGQTIQGTLTLTDDDGSWSHDKVCSGDGGYSDIRGGAQVVVSNEGGEIIATSDLEQGVGKDLVFRIWELGVELAESEGRTPAPSPELGDPILVQCEFDFTVEVGDATFYSIEVSHRGELRFSRAEMEESDWTVGFTLGD